MNCINSYEANYHGTVPQSSSGKTPQIVEQPLVGSPEVVISDETSRSFKQRSDHTFHALFIAPPKIHEQEATNRLEAIASRLEANTASSKKLLVKCVGMKGHSERRATSICVRVFGSFGPSI